MFGERTHLVIKINVEELVFIYGAGSQTQNVVLGSAIKLHTVKMVGFCEYVVRKTLEYISERPQLKRYLNSVLQNVPS